MKKIIFTTKIFILLSALLMIGFSSCKQTVTDQKGTLLYQVPRALIITTGKDGVGNLPEGALLIMESFISQGTYTRIATRDALLDEDYLAQFNILVLSTAIGFHDGDREQSLSFMDDVEIDILSQWVYNGGVLIVGDNVGRNLRSGVDRISLYSRLHPDNWTLSSCFGVTLSERKLDGFRLKGHLSDKLSGELMPKLPENSWLLVPDSLLNSNTEVLAFWEKDTLRFPALTVNRYGKGLGFLLPVSRLLEPSNSGGVWNTMQLNAFCKIVLEKYYERYSLKVAFSPWPYGAPTALAVSINCDGKFDNCKEIMQFLKAEDIHPTLFVSSSFNKKIVSLARDKNFRLQSNNYLRTNMRLLSYSETVFQIEMNEKLWQKDFTGFRFPFTMNSYWGMLYLDRKNYSYDSSIGVDHIESYYGSLFPYHIPIFYRGNYQSLNLLEVSPMAKDDYSFFDFLDNNPNPTPEKIYKKARLFDAYLQNFFKNICLPRGGMMVYLGHPYYSAFNDTTLMPLKNLIDTANHYGAWMTSLEEIASRWQIIDDMKIKVSHDKEVYFIDIAMPEEKVLESAAIRICTKPVKVKAKYGSFKIDSQEEEYVITFAARNKQRLELFFE